MNRPLLQLQGVAKRFTLHHQNQLSLPVFDGEMVTTVVGATDEKPQRFCTAFPDHVAKGYIALKLAGAGGDGAQTAAMLIAQAGINEGFDATHIPSYGPESRGGTSYADVHIASGEVLSPSSPAPDILVAFNAPSLAKFGPAVRAGGTIVYDSSVIAEGAEPPGGVRQFGIPFTEIAMSMRKPVVKNVVALGALQAATNLFPVETFLTALHQALKEKPQYIALNEAAFAEGRKAIAVQAPA